MESRKNPVEGLHYGIAKTTLGTFKRDLESSRHQYLLGVGSKEQLQDWAKDDQLITMKDISSRRKLMTSEAVAHFQKRMKDGAGRSANLGHIGFQVRKKDGKVIAYAYHYYPKETVKEIRSDTRGRRTGISASDMEADCLEHLMVNFGITHVTTSDGYNTRGEYIPCEDTSRERRDQLEAHGIKPLETYPIREWIEKLRSKPDYSKIKK